jgi:hypothetical protein
MAPEQLTGQSRDTRTDVFALGVLVYEFAAGEHPFAAATPLAIAARVLSETPPPLAGMRPDLPLRFTAVVDRCLSKLREGRFATAGELRRVTNAAPSAVTRAGGAFWWRAHQAIVLALYFVASIGAWKVKEAWGGPTTPVFLVIGIAATITGVFRAHMLFTERTNSPRFDAERRRSQPVTLAADMVLALGPDRRRGLYRGAIASCRSPCDRAWHRRRARQAGHRACDDGGGVRSSVVSPFAASLRITDQGESGWEPLIRTCVSTGACWQRQKSVSSCGSRCACRGRSAPTICPRLDSFRC